MSKIRKAIIPAAGFGTRFLPQTKAMPKEMLPLVDKPIIQYIVEELVGAGITDIILVTGYHKRTIEDHFDAANLDLIENLRMGGEKKRPLLEEIEKISSMANFIYLRQKGPYGNGTPLLNARHLIGDEPFIFAFSDDFIDAKPKTRFQQMIDLYNEFGCTILSSIKATKDEDYDRYGFAGGEEIRPGVIEAKVVIEKPGKQAAPSDFATVSSTLFTPEIFKYLDQARENLQEGAELYYNDALKLMLEDRGKVVAALVEDGKYYDTGNKLEYMKTVVEFALKHPDVNGKFKEFLKSLDL